MILPSSTISSRSSCGKLRSMFSTLCREHEHCASYRRRAEHAHALLVEQTIGEALARQIRIDQFDDRRRSRPANGPRPRRHLPAQRAARCPPAHRRDRDPPGARVRRTSAGTAAGCRRRANAVCAPFSPPRNSSRDREPHAGRNLLRAQKILVRGVFEVVAFERHQSLIAAHVGTLVDGHGEMAVAEQLAGRGLARGDRRCDAVGVKPRARLAPCRAR